MTTTTVVDDIIDHYAHRPASATRAAARWIIANGGCRTALR